MNNFMKTGLVAITASLAASASHAGLEGIGSADVAFANPIFGTTGSDTVKIRYRDDSGELTSMRTSAGRFTGAVSSDDFDANIMYEDADNVFLYCVDLFQSVGSGWNVDYEVHKLSEEGPNTLSTDAHQRERDFGRTLDFLGALNFTLANSYGVDFGQYSWLNPRNSWMSGAIQLGIWESLYEDFSPEGASWDIDAGDFSVVGTGGKDINPRGSVFLDEVFSNIEGTNALESKYVLVLTSDTRQDMIVGDPPIGVSAPASATLLLAGLGVLRRRRR
ncbi:MAG: hypothetical protein AB8B57_15325 [Congregibacter sp.]